MHETQEEDDVIELRMAVETLRALYPGGLEGLPHRLIKALERDDYSDALAEANASYSKGGPRDLAAVLAYVALLNGRGLLGEAKGILRKAQGIYERDVALQLLQLQTMLLDDQFDEAQAVLEGLGHVPIQEPRYLAFMGELHLSLEAPEQAMACFEQAMDRGLDDPDIAYQLAQMHQEQERWFDAAQTYERVARQQMQDAGLWQEAATAWTQAEEPGKAAECMRRVVKLRADDEYAWLYYGVALAEDGQLERAKGALERACKLDPLLFEAWVQRAHAERELGFVEEAIQHYRHALTLRDDDLEAMHGLIAAAFESGDLLMAERLSRKAVTLAPHDPDGYYNLGTVLQELHKNAEAITSFERAVALDDEVPSFQIALAVALAQADEVGRACEHAQAALALDPEEPEELVLELVETLLRRRHPEEALRFMGQLQLSGDRWEALAALLSYLALIQLGQRDALTAQLERFERAHTAMRVSAMGPAEWDFEGLERLIDRLEHVDHDARRQAEAMLHVLERGVTQAA